MNKRREKLKTLLKRIYLPVMCLVQTLIPLAVCFLSAIYQESFWKQYSRVLANLKQKVIVDIEAISVCKPGYDPEFSFVFPGTLFAAQIVS